MNDCPHPTATTSIQFRLHFGGYYPSGRRLLLVSLFAGSAWVVLFYMLRENLDLFYFILFWFLGF
jgi:hypothetical protein